MRYLIGRIDEAKNALVPAFRIRRDDAGGIHIAPVGEPITAEERHRLFAHFGAPFRARSGGSESGQHYETLIAHAPGTQAHFDSAVYRLPKPFGLMKTEKV